MKKWAKILSIIIIILVLIISIYFIIQLLNKDYRMCGTPFIIRNSTGGCELRVGCELPEGVIEDPPCREIIRQQIDGNNS